MINPLKVEAAVCEQGTKTGINSQGPYFKDVILNLVFSSLHIFYRR